MSVFKVGMEVVCVDDAPMSDIHEKPPLVRGAAYFIDAIGDEGHGLALRLTDPSTYYNMPSEATRVQWSVSRFRPAVKRSTDISIFTSMLNPSNAKETV